jgi:hypothetical protein
MDAKRVVNGFRMLTGAVAGFLAVPPVGLVLARGGILSWEAAVMGIFVLSLAGVMAGKVFCMAAKCGRGLILASLPLDFMVVVGISFGIQGKLFSNWPLASIPISAALFLGFLRQLGAKLQHQRLIDEVRVTIRLFAITLGFIVLRGISTIAQLDLWATLSYLGIWVCSFLTFAMYARSLREGLRACQELNRQLGQTDRPIAVA